jgi:hypothetical protein
MAVNDHAVRVILMTDVHGLRARLPRFRALGQPVTGSA